jgi:aspartyl-tRNA(Asn)/glutamyl-tRNA(Gln) amidotransferase subunit A
MSDLAYLTIAEAARLIKARKLSPVEFTRALLARIAATDSTYHAYIAVTQDLAIAQAKAAEAELMRGDWRGPMHGVPYAAKDIFDVAGMATTCHSKLRIDHCAGCDATAIVKLREAGAVLLGKLALHEFATGGPTRELPWPAACNPWNVDLHPGGSSSGSGVAVAIGTAPGALGTDTGGSVRNPATCCGVIGMKPTFGTVSRAGVFPLAFSLDHVGPLTRTVEDNAIMLQAIAAHDPADPTSSRRPAADFTGEINAGVKGLRIGLIAHFYDEDMIAVPEQSAAIAAAADVLRRLGAEVTPIRLSSLQRYTECGRTILMAEAFAIHEPDLKERPQDYAAITRRKLLPGAFTPAADYVKAQQLRSTLCAEFAAAMRGLDAAITLSSLDMPCRIDDDETIAKTYERQARMPFNVTGTPAIAVPTGFTAAGLPTAMQILGRAFAEPMVYRVAQAYCEATRWCEHHPLVKLAQRKSVVEEADVKYHRTEV